MKKLLILLTLCATLPALATTICADDDVIAIVLDPNVAAIGHKENPDIFEWGVTFPYGSIWGIATCMDVKGTSYGSVEELRSEDGEIATGGERKGPHCWCKMTHPVVSSWVYNGSHSSTNECAGKCAGNGGCAFSIWYRTELRAALFGSTLH